MTYPVSADLSSPSNGKYYQGPGNRCRSYGFLAALEILCDRSGTSHVGRRFSRNFTHAVARNLTGVPLGDQGVNIQELRVATAFWGVADASTFSDSESVYTQPPPEAFANAEQNKPVVISQMKWVGNTVMDSIRAYICAGIPVLIAMDVNDAYRSLSGDWRTHSYDSSNSPIFHAACIVGYDDSVGRVKVQDSAYGLYGDPDGFTGLTYDKLEQGSQRVVQQYDVISHAFVSPVKASGYMPPIPQLTPQECREFVDVQKPSLRADLEAAMNTNGAQGIKDEMIRQGASDKLVEELLQLPRGEVQAWFQAAGIPKGAMIWLPLV